MSAAGLARRLDVPVQLHYGILNGRRAITGDTASRAARFFGTAGAFRLTVGASRSYAWRYCAKSLCVLNSYPPG